MLAVPRVDQAKICSCKVRQDLTKKTSFSTTRVMLNTEVLIEQQQKMLHEVSCCSTLSEETAAQTPKIGRSKAAQLSFKVDI